jgi:hypothetical protein
MQQLFAHIINFNVLTCDVAAKKESSVTRSPLSVPYPQGQKESKRFAIDEKNVCILRESNPGQLLGRQLSYRWTKNAD